MSLTNPQLITFKADILANTDSEVITARNVGNNSAIAEWYSRENIIDFWIFKKLVSIDEVSEVIELDDVANMTAGDNVKLNTFFNIRQGGVFANKASDRDGFDDIFSATAGNDSQQALKVLWQRLATNIERLFATGTGTNAVPAQLVVEGAASLQNVRDALAS